MKALIPRGLARAGFVPVSQVERADARMRRLSEKSARFKARFAEVRASADTWKRRHEETAAAAAEWKEAAERAGADVERARAEIGMWRQQAKALTLQVRELEEQLDGSRQALALAGEQRAAIEAQLSVIEAAIHFLNAR